MRMVPPLAVVVGAYLDAGYARPGKEVKLLLWTIIQSS